MIPMKLASCAFAGTLGLAALPALAQDAPPQSARKDCLSVELMMYSGRPRPQYLLCGEDEKTEATRKIADIREEKAENVPYPTLEPSPEYQGVLLTLPKKPGERASRVFLRKGYVKVSGSDKVLVDKGRDLEQFFLDRSLKEKDISESPGKGNDLRPLAAPILEKLKAEMKAK